MGHGTSTDELDIIMLCKEMKWTYTEYENNPHWFIEGLMGIMRIDTKEQNKQSKKYGK